MMKKYVSTLVMWLSFVIYFFIYLTKKLNLWFVLDFWSISFSIYLLVKCKLPSLKSIIISIIFTILVVCSYLGYVHKFIIQMLFNGLPTLFCSLAVFSVMEKFGGFELIKKDTKSAPVISVLIGLGTGTILGIINYLLGKNGMSVNFGITFSRLLVCLNPAIYEEIACRSLFMAFFTYIFTIKGEKTSKFESFTMYFMMAIPHNLAHGAPLLDSLILLVLFGLPFAILQKKRDITSAMISHGMVDVIRMCVFGY